MHSLGRLQRIFLVGMSVTVMSTVTALADQAGEDVDNIVVPGAGTTNTLEEIPNTTAAIRRPARGRDQGFDISSGSGILHRWAR